MASLSLCYSGIYVAILHGFDQGRACISDDCCRSDRSNLEVLDTTLELALDLPVAIVPATDIAWMDVGTERGGLIWQCFVEPASHEEGRSRCVSTIGLYGVFFVHNRETVLFVLIEDSRELLERRLRSFDTEPELLVLQSQVNSAIVFPAVIVAEDMPSCQVGCLHGEAEDQHRTGNLGIAAGAAFQAVENRHIYRSSLCIHSAEAAAGVGAFILAPTAAAHFTFCPADAFPSAISSIIHIHCCAVWA
mmetsp:Transcript_14175/g.33458  ORF Transcript_14175/g.33458 Transcript_14175/m.33458 type:complete len:248 (+) Transcript_14175:231-974(+)